MASDLILIIINFLTFLIPLLISVAYLTLLERKILGAIQRRFGPDQVGFMGLLQPISDAAKLIFKETVLPVYSNKFLYILAPILSFMLAISVWAVIPLGFFGCLAAIDLGLIYIFAISSLGVYSIVISGWASGSRYAFLGALRSSAQMISYEVSFGLVLVSILLCVNSLNIYDVVMFQYQNGWFIVPFFPLFIVFFVSTLAETNRSPFDLPEAEAELVSGYNVEYSSISFALFFIAEYMNIILMSVLNVCFFFGGWTSPLPYLEFIPDSIWFSFKICFFLILFIWVRAVLPRYRYNQLMSLGWKVFLPISFGYVAIVSIILICLKF